MLGKLLKYDLKYMFKNMIVFYILAIIFGVFTRILFSSEQTVIINVLGQISVGCMFSMVFSILFNTIIRSFVRFRDSLYKDESYLTHTLPVSKTQIYESKFLEALIFTICGFVFMLVSLFITYYTEERWLLLKDTINSISSGLNLNIIFVIILVVFVFFLEVINIIQTGFLGLILGHKKNNNKVAFSLLFGFIIYIFSQCYVLLLIFVFGLFDLNIMSIFTSTSLTNNSVIYILSLLSIVFYSSLIVIMNIICSKELEKGVNV